MSLTTGASALSAVSEAVMDVLNVEAFSGTTGVCPGGVWDDLPQDSTYPITWYEVSEVPFNNLGQFGKELQLRLQVFSQQEGLREAQNILAMAVDLLNAAVPTVAGFTFQWFDDLGRVQLASFLKNGRNTKVLECRYTVIVTEID